MLSTFLNRVFRRNVIGRDAHIDAHGGGQPEIETGTPQFGPAPLRAPLMFVLLAKPASLSEALTEDKLRDALVDPKLTITRPEDDDGNSFVINWHRNAYTVFLVPHPVPSSEFAALRSPGTGAQEKQIAERHGAHLVVSPLQSPSDMGAAIPQSFHLMLLADALGSALGNVLGYYWSHSQQILEPDAFIKQLSAAVDAMTRNRNGEKSTSSSLPLTFWVGIRLFSDGTKRAGLTSGLVAFTGYEIEIAFSERPDRDVFRYLASCVAYLFANGPVLSVGQTIHLEPDGNFCIGFVPRDNSFPPTLVLKQDPEPTKAKRK